MTRSSLRTFALSVSALLLALLSPALAAAQGGGVLRTRDLHRLGGSTAFYPRPLPAVASLKDMATRPLMAADLRKTLGQAGLTSLGDNVMAALAGANTSVVGGVCTDATPAVGTIVECDVRPGDTLRWMAFRPKGGRSLEVLSDLRWAGKKPFKAYLFRVVEDRRTYTFVVPKDCGNLSLMATQDAPAAVVAMAAPAPAPPPPPAPPAPEPVALAVATAPAPMQVPPPAPMAAVASRGTPFFADALFGKERRVRPVDNSELEFAQCSPLFGVKAGLAKRFTNDWELTGAVGVALSLVDKDTKVREHALFVDLVANKYLANGMFLGTGLSLWDITRSDTFTPAWLVDVGVPLNKGSRVPVYFLVEGRVLLDHADDIASNYQFWGGVRVRF